MSTYEFAALRDSTLITEEAEKALWSRFYDLCADGAVARNDLLAMRTFISAAPVMKVRYDNEGRFFEGFYRTERDARSFRYLTISLYEPNSPAAPIEAIMKDEVSEVHAAREVSIA